MLRKNISAILSLIIIFTALTFCLPAVHAEGSNELILTCKDGDLKVSRMLWQIYRIGERQDNGFVLTGQFSGYPVDMKNLTEENIGETAQVLESFVIGDSLTEYAHGKTDENGVVRFSDIEPGLYLAVPNQLHIGYDTYYSLPLIAEVNGNEKAVFPKIYVMSTLSGTDARYTVKKVWIDHDNEYESRPVDITVDIYNNGENFDTVTLNESNGWEYSWDARDMSPGWKVVERNIPRDYTVLIDSAQTQFLIKNSFAGTSSITTTPSASTITAASSTTSAASGSGLPQTGQPWMPVYILAAGGIGFIFLGLFLKLREDKHEK